MTKEQREAVERLMHSRCVDRLSGYDHEALQLLLDLLTPPDKDRRALVTMIPRPTADGSCSTACLWCGDWDCQYSKPWALVDYGGEIVAEEAAPGPGCPWHEEEER